MTDEERPNTSEPVPPLKLTPPPAPPSSSEHIRMPSEPTVNAPPFVPVQLYPVNKRAVLVALKLPTVRSVRSEGPWTEKSVPGVPEPTPKRRLVLSQKSDVLVPTRAIPWPKSRRPLVSVSALVPP